DKGTETIAVHFGVSHGRVINTLADKRTLRSVGEDLYYAVQSAKLKRNYYKTGRPSPKHANLFAGLIVNEDGKGWHYDDKQGRRTLHDSSTAGQGDGSFRSFPY